MDSRYHLKIAGQGFLMRPTSYRRSVLALDSSLSTRHSPLAPAWRQWQQSDWRGGDGQDVWDSGSRWRLGYGVDISGAGKVRLGPTLSPSYSSSEDAFAAMLTFQGKLYALSGSSGKIYSYDGATWGVAHDTGKASLRSLARHGDRLYAGSGSDGALFQGDGATWSAAIQVADADAVTCMASYGVWDPAARATVPRLFLGCSFPDSEARIYHWDGSALVEVQRCQESTVEAMAVYAGRLYLATSDSGNGVQGRILCFDGRSGSGEWSEAARLSDNYVADWTLFDNLLFCGSGLGGRLWTFDGDHLLDAYSLSTPTLAYQGSLRALAVCSGRLYVAYSHPTQGLALLCKLPAALLEDAEMGRQGDTERHGCRIGWYTPCAAGAGGIPRAMAPYGGQLYLATEHAGAATIYRQDGDSHRSSGLLETSFFDAGYPGTAKLLRGLTLGHDKLLPGQYLETSFALEDSDLFQQMEDFGDLAGCDQALTTADWRPTGSLVRLRGMPTLGFAGKQQGDQRVPHRARRLLSADPNSPPAAFTEEFDNAGYEAISTIGDDVAVTTSASQGSYAHQLFEFDLAGLVPAGLHPRAICYGKGDAFGAPAPGATLRIWNHTSAAWDLVGSNTATPGDSPAVRTIEATTASFGDYTGPSGKLYLSLRPSPSGSQANPSEVGSDLVELSALWAEIGEAVSQPLRLPVSLPVSSATLTLLSSQIPLGTGIELFMSADDGEHWEPVAGGVEHNFSHSGSSLRWKARLYTTDGLASPSIGRLKVDYLTGSRLPLGRSELEGSTSASFTFESDIAARRVAFRVELGSSDPLGTPALSSLTLQYSLQPELKRQWELDLLCEGASGLPLRLLDGSHEGKTGRELSQLLWQARARGAIPFEDLDGSRYQVWLEKLEEELSNAPQERGVQTIARCTLIEC